MEQIKIPVRIYQDLDGSGILAAVQDSKGMCFVGYKSPGKRYCVRTDIEGLKEANSLDISNIRQILDGYAEEHNLVELPWNL